MLIYVILIMLSITCIILKKHLSDLQKVVNMLYWDMEDLERFVEYDQDL